MLTVVFGELVSKVFALRNAEWVCLKQSPPMKWFVTAVWPVVWLLEAAVTGLMALVRAAGSPQTNCGRPPESSCRTPGRCCT